jgi:cell division protein FtsI (penicillin-binding protein 3)
MSTGRGLTIDSRRLTLLVFGLVLGVTVVTGRLVYYQIFRHDELKEWSAEQCTWEKSIPARRGDITDVNGHLLALDAVEWDVSVSPPLVTGGDELAGDLSGILGMPQTTVLTAFDAKAPWVHLAKGVDHDVGEAILALGAGGVSCDPAPRRFYPEGSLFAHLVGIVNTTGDGFYGVEGYHNQILHGVEGKKIVEQ